MLTSLRLKRAAVLNRISEHSPISLALSVTAGDRTAGASSSYSSLSHAQDRRILLPRNDNHAILAPSTVISQQFGHGLICSPMVRACFSSEAAIKESTAPTEDVADLYQKMLKSVEEARSMPPNANLWSLVEKCTNREDIKLLFQILERLRVFRLSNLRIHANFNCHLCISVTKACTRADAPGYGDAESIWKIEKLRSKAVKKHTIASGFSCAKGYLIERNPESAASAINLMYKDLPDKKKAVIADEFEKLVVEWSKQVIKRQKKEDREALAEALKSDISAMAASLLNMGIDAKVNVDDLQC